MRTNLILILLTLVFLGAVGGVLYFSIQKKEAGTPEVKGCTMEALICPDGTSVGRSGPSCEFTPCPSRGSLSGTYLNDAQGKRLVVPAPPSGRPGEVTYAVPLDPQSVAIPDRLNGETLVLDGNFTHGTTFLATAFATTTSLSGKGEASGTLSIGGSTLLSGVKITLNGITADSRCPEGVQCIRAGEVKANVTLESDTDKTTLDLSSGDPPHGFDMWQVSITDVTPAKTQTTIAPTDYHITFKVERLK